MSHFNIYTTDRGERNMGKPIFRIGQQVKVQSGHIIGRLTLPNIVIESGDIGTIVNHDKYEPDATLHGVNISGEICYLFWCEIEPTTSNDGGDEE
jgi:hypothetical protein